MEKSLSSVAGFHEKEEIDFIIHSRKISVQTEWYTDNGEESPGEKEDLSGISIGFDYLISLRNCNNLIHPHDVGYIDEMVRDLDSGRVVDFNFRVITPSGHIRALKGVGAIQNSEAKLADFEHLSDDELHLKILKYAEQVANIGSWTWNLTTNEIFFSDHVFRLYGLKQETVKNTWNIFAALLHPEDSNRVLKERKMMYESAEPFSTEFRIYRGTDNALRYLKEKTELFITATGERYFIGVTQDITKEKLAKQKLDESHHLNDQVIKSVPGLIIIINVLTNHVIFADKRFSKLLDDHDGTGNEYERFLRIIHPHDVAIRERQLNEIKSTKSKKTFSVSIRLKTSDSSWRWFCIRETAFNHDACGNVTETIAFVHDIHDLKEAEEQVAQTKNLLQAVFNASDHAITYLKGKYDQHHELIRFEIVVENNVAKTLSKNGFLKPFIRNSKDPVVQYLFEKFQEVAVTGEPADFELSYTDKWFRITVVKLDDGVVATLKDFTKTKVAELELKAHKELLEKSLDAIPQMIWVSDASGKILFMNDHCYHYTGLSHEHKTNFALNDLNVFHPSQSKEILGSLQTMIEKNIPYHAEVLVRDTQNNYRWHIHDVKPVRNSIGDVIIWVGTLTDVHDLYISDKKLKDTKDLLEALYNASMNGIQIFESVYSSDNHVKDLKWKFHNSRTEELLNRKNLRGKKLLEEFPGMKTNGLFDICKRVIETGCSTEFEHHYCEDGLDIWYHFTMYNVEDFLIVSFQDITQRKLKERELKDSKHFIHEIANATPDLLYVIDVIDKKVIYINSNTIDPSQKTNLLHPDIRLQTILDELNRNPIPALKNFQNDSHHVYEMDLLLKVNEHDSEWFKIRHKVFKRKDDGAVWQVLGIAQNIHEKKIAANKMLVQHWIDRQAEKIAQLGNWSFDVDSGEVTWGENLYNILGYAPGSVKPDFEVFINSIHPDDRPLIIADRERIRKCADGPMDSSIFRVVKNDGSIRFLQTVSELITVGNQRLAIGTIRDITKDFELQRELKERLRFIEALIDASLDQITVIDKALKFLLWNKACERYSSLRKHEMIGKHLLDSFPWLRDNVKILDGLHKAIEGESTSVTVMSEIFSHGAFDLYLVPLRDEKNIVYAVLMIIHDISDKVNARKQLESFNQSLSEKNHELESLNEELSTFAFIASHDLREPIRKIQLFTDMILDREKTNLSSQAKETFRKMIGSIDRLNSLIDEILTFSRASAGKPKMLEFNLNQIFELVKNDLNEAIVKSGAIINADPLPEFYGNPLQFSQLLQHMVSNGIKFQLPGNTPEIKITASFVHGDEIAHPRVLRGKKYLKLEITDNGIGFEEKYAGKIFQMFQRLHTINQFPGTGMGLAICKKVVENHNGFILVKSSPGFGATFTCYLPDLKDHQS